MTSVLRSVAQTPSKFLMAVTTTGYFPRASGSEDAGTLVLDTIQTVTAGQLFVDMGKVQLINGETYLKIGRNVAGTTPIIGYIPLNSQDGFHGYNLVLGWARL